MRETTMDAFRLVSKFYEVIKASALHIYHSALVFTPTQPLLYKRHCKEMTHKACWLRGGLAQWDPLISASRHPVANFVTLKFSPDSSQLASDVERHSILGRNERHTYFVFQSWRG